MGIKVREKQKGSGEFWIFINHEGRRKSVKVGSLAVAEEVAERLTAKLKFDPDAVFKEREAPKPAFKVLAKEWIKKLEKQGRKASTLERYNQLLDDWVLPAVGSKKVDEIKKSHIADVLSKAHDEGLSVASLGNIRTCFSGPLEIAAFREMIPANPTYNILQQIGFSRKKDHKSKEIRFFTPEESYYFLDTCQKEFPDYYAFFQLLFMTGLRLGEALAVTWQDVNWQEKTVSINKAFRTILATTKTGGEREVDLPDTLVTTLKTLETKRKREALKAGLKKPEIIFHLDGGHMSQQKVRSIFDKILKQAKLPRRRLHDVRHSYASLLLKNGASLDYVKRMMGHSDISMTSNTYGHLMPNRDRSQINQLGEIILFKSAPTPHPKNEKNVTY